MNLLWVESFFLPRPIRMNYFGLDGVSERIGRGTVEKFARNRGREWNMIVEALVSQAVVDEALRCSRVDQGVYFSVRKRWHLDAYYEGTRRLGSDPDRWVVDRF
jgi:hypothetical protein